MQVPAGVWCPARIRVSAGIGGQPRVGSLGQGQARSEHTCKSVGQGKPMYHLILITTAGTLQTWDEVGNQNLGAVELMDRTQGQIILDEILQQVIKGEWQLTVEGTVNRHG